MTDLKTNRYDPIDYCIEISRMLGDRKEDVNKFVMLFKEAIKNESRSDFFSEYATENDKMLVAFCNAVNDCSKQNHLPMSQSLVLRYKLHCRAPLHDLIFEENDTEKDKERKIKNVESIWKDVVDETLRRPRQEKHRTRLQRILDRFRRR